MRIIGLTELRAAVLKAIEQKGADYIYPHAGGTCLYFEGEELANSCGIGYAIDTLELKGKAIDLIDQYRRENIASIGQIPEPTAEELLRMFNEDDEDGVMFTAAAKHWALCFQIRQDEGAAWGSAAKYADSRAGSEEQIGIRRDAPPSEGEGMTAAFGSMHSTDKHSHTL